MTPTEWTQDTPEELFLALWRKIAIWPAERRTDAIYPPGEVRHAFSLALRETGANDAASGLIAAAQSAWPSAIQPYSADYEAGIVLAAMAAIDEAFVLIHPRSALLPPGTPGRKVLPEWLSAARDRRTTTGVYADDGAFRLLPRGPFAREARAPAETSADAAQDYFSALAAAPLASAHEDMPVEIRIEVIDQSYYLGVPPGPRRGRERIGLVPLAERGSELRPRIETRAGNTYLAVEPAADFEPHERLLEALSTFGTVDLVVAPELTMPEADAERFADTLVRVPQAARLIFSGTGTTRATDSKGRGWNKGSMLNSAGRPLWSHQKVWPYGMSRDRAQECCRVDLEPGKMLMEETVSGASVTVADVDSFGRVITLICQDFQMDPVVGEVLRAYQPDWVVVPIMDVGVGSGRWMHTRAFELAGKSRARFVILSSLAMAEWSGATDTRDTGVALLVGPRTASEVERSDGSTDRAVAVLSCGATKPMTAEITWGNDPRWEQTFLRKE